MPATSDEKKRANELRIRNATAAELLPSYRENGGAKQSLLAVGDCVLPADLEGNDAYSDLVVITAVSLSERRVTDVENRAREAIKQAADKAAKAASYFSFWTFMALLFGAVAAVLGGIVGGELRDQAEVEAPAMAR